MNEKKEKEKMNEKQEKFPKNMFKLRSNTLCIDLRQHSNTGQAKLSLRLACSLPSLKGAEYQEC